MAPAGPMAHVPEHLIHDPEHSRVAGGGLWLREESTVSWASPGRVLPAAACSPRHQSPGQRPRATTGQGLWADLRTTSPTLAPFRMWPHGPDSLVKLSRAVVNTVCSQLQEDVGPVHVACSPARCWPGLPRPGRASGPAFLFLPAFLEVRT